MEEIISLIMTTSEEQLNAFLNKFGPPGPIKYDTMDCVDFIISFNIPDPISVAYAMAVQKEYKLQLDGDIEKRANSIVDTLQLYKDKGLEDLLLELEISNYMDNDKLLKKVMSMKKI